MEHDSLVQLWANPLETECCGVMVWGPVGGECAYCLSWCSGMYFVWVLMLDVVVWKMIVVPVCCCDVGEMCRVDNVGFLLYYCCGVCYYAGKGWMKRKRDGKRGSWMCCCDEMG